MEYTFSLLTTETLKGEEWRDIEGFNGKYQISNYGRVKSLKHKQPLILKQQDNSSGYPRVTLSHHGVHK